MKIAFIDNAGSLFSVAWNVQLEGHDVIYYTHENDKDSKRIGLGLVDRPDKISDVIEWLPDVAVLYNVPGVVATLEKAGINHFGSSFAGKRLEDDRMFGCNLVKQYNIGRCPETREFRDINQAREFITSRNSGRKKWVFKAQGGSEVDVSTTHVSDDTEHLLEILNFEETLNRAKSFILQEKVDGIEISIEGWFHYQTGWIKPINSTLERKRLMNDDKGPMTGCMGSIVWPWSGDSPRLFRQTLLNMTDWLIRMKYKAPIDGNYIIDYKTRQPWFLEFTPRIGWNAFEALMNGFRGSMGEFLVAFGRGNDKNLSMKFKDRFMGAVRVYTPAVENVPIKAPIKEDSRLFPRDIYLDKDTLKTVGTDVCNNLAVIFEATGSGDSVKECVTEIYEDVIPEITASDLTYRTDIGKQAIEDIELLEQFGYIVR